MQTPLINKYTIHRLLIHMEETFKKNNISRTFPNDMEKDLAKDVVGKLYNIGRDSKRNSSSLFDDIDCRFFGIGKYGVKKNMDRASTGWDFKEYMVYTFLFKFENNEKKVINVPAIVAYANAKPVLVLNECSIKVGSPHQMGDSKVHLVDLTLPYDSIVKGIANLVYELLDENDYYILNIINSIPNYEIRDPYSMNTDYGKQLSANGYNPILLEKIGKRKEFNFLPAVKFENNEITDIMVTDRHLISSVDYDKYFSGRYTAIVFGEEEFFINGDLPEHSFTIQGRHYNVDNEEWVKNDDGTFRSTFVISCESYPPADRGYRFGIYGESSPNEVKAVKKSLRQISDGYKRKQKDDRMRKKLDREVMDTTRRTQIVREREMLQSMTGTGREYEYGIENDTSDDASRNIASFWITELFELTRKNQYEPTEEGLDELEEYYKSENKRYKKRMEECRATGDFRKERIFYQLLKENEYTLKRIKEERQRREDLK